MHRCTCSGARFIRPSSTKIPFDIHSNALTSPAYLGVVCIACLANYYYYSDGKSRDCLNEKVVLAPAEPPLHMSVRLYVSAGSSGCAKCVSFCNKCSGLYSGIHDEENLGFQVI